MKYLKRLWCRVVGHDPLWNHLDDIDGMFSGYFCLRCHKPLTKKEQAE